MIDGDGARMKVSQSHLIMGTIEKPSFSIWDIPKRNADGTEVRK